MKENGGLDIKSPKEEPIKISAQDQAVIDKTLEGTQKPERVEVGEILDQIREQQGGEINTQDLFDAKSLANQVNNKNTADGELANPEGKHRARRARRQEQKEKIKEQKDAEQGDLYQSFIERNEEADKKLEFENKKKENSGDEQMGDAWDSYLKRHGELTRSGGGQIEMTDEQWEAARAKWVAEHQAQSVDRSVENQPEVEAQPATGGAGNQVENQTTAASPSAEQPPVNSDDPLDLENLEVGELGMAGPKVEQPENQEQPASPEQETTSVEQSVENAAVQNNLDANQELSPEQARAAVDEKFNNLKAAIEAEAKTQKNYGYFAKLTNKLGLISKNSQAHEEYGKMVEARKSARKEYDQAINQYTQVLVRKETQRLKSEEGLKDDKKELKRRISSFLVNRDVVNTNEKVGDQEKAVSLSVIEFINKQERELAYLQKETLDNIQRGIWGKMAKAVFSDAPKYIKEKLVDLREKYKLDFDKPVIPISRVTKEDLAKKDAKIRAKEKKLEAKMATKAAKGKSIEKETKKYAKRERKKSTAYETVAKGSEQVGGIYTLYYELMNHLEYDENEVVPILEAFERQSVLSLQKEYGITKGEAEEYFDWRVNNIREDDIFRIWRTGSRKRLEIVGFNKDIHSEEYENFSRRGPLQQAA